MKHIIIGSTALKHHGLYNGIPKDIDVFVSDRLCGSSTVKLQNYDYIVLPQNIIDMIPNTDGYATLDALYTIKCSHLGWDIKWQKHKSGVLCMKALGAKKIPGLYSTLVEHWRETNGNKEYLSLYKKKTDFFNDYVPYVYDHDYLHELVAYPDAPVYTHCLKEDEDVAIDKEKFDSLSLQQQLKMFKEEVSVIAAERWLIPKKVCGKYTWMQAYSLALHKTVVSLTKNWATDFLIEHLDYFVKPEFIYFKHLLNTLEEGKVIMSKVIENKNSIRDEIFEAYNATTPEYPVDPEEFTWNEFDEIPDFDGFENIEQEGGGEGGGEYCYRVFMWKGDYYKLEYSYYSHQGYDFDYCTLYNVIPKEVKAIIYV